MSPILNIIIPAIAGIISSSFTTIAFFPQMRNSKKISNESQQSAEWKKLYEETKKDLKIKDQKIDQLYTEITKQRDKKADMSKENIKLEVENTRLQFLKCEVKQCPNRKPPTGY